MIDLQLAQRFWSAVQECMERFHGIASGEAEQRVEQAKSQLPRLPEDLVGETPSSQDEREIADPSLLPSFEDMIYHAEPWFVAAVLSDSDQLVPDDQNRRAYRALLVRHRLAPPA